MISRYLVTKDIEKDITHMYKRRSYTSDDIVSKNIRMEYMHDGDEEFIPGTSDVILNNAASDVLIYLIRTPFVAPFSKEQHSRDHRRLTKYQLAMINCIDGVSRICNHNEQTNEFKPYSINPNIECIISEISNHFLKENEEGYENHFYPLRWMSVNEFYLLDRHERLKVIKATNALAENIRNKLLSSGFRELVHSFRRNSTECYKQLMNVGKYVWGKYGKVLLIRLDWGYRSTYPDLRAKFSSQEDFELRFKEVSEIRKKMLKSLRGMFGDDLAFYAWKIECAPIKGLHIHWMIGLNGYAHQDRINVPRKIADHWDQFPGNEKAYTWNLSAMQNNENAILRVIGYDDPLLWRILGGYADYLTKIDYFVRMKTPAGMHSFGSTHVPDKSKKKRGPKRSKEMPVLDIWEVRGNQVNKIKEGQ